MKITSLLFAGLLIFSTSMTGIAQEVASNVKLKKITIQENKYTTELVFSFDGNSSLTINSGRGTQQEEYDLSLTSDKEVKLLTSENHKLTYWDMNNNEKKTVIWYKCYKISGSDFGYVTVLKDVANQNIAEVIFSQNPFDFSSPSNVGKRSYQFRSEKKWASDEQDFEITEFYEGSSTGWWPSTELDGTGSFTLKGKKNGQNYYEVTCISE